MAKVQIKSEKLTPFGGIFSIMEQFDSMLSPIIDQTLGQRCRSIIGYQYSEIIRSLMSVYFCGGSCVEDVTSHLMRHLGSVVILGGLSLVNSLHAYTFASLKRKKLISTTPLNDALNALILALNASAAAFVLLFTKKFRILS